MESIFCTPQGLPLQSTRKVYNKTILLTILSKTVPYIGILLSELIRNNRLYNRQGLVQITIRLPPDLLKLKQLHSRARGRFALNDNSPAIS